MRRSAVAFHAVRRAGVEQAIATLGTGFLRHAQNRSLRHALEQGSLDKQDYYRQLLRLAYRLLFLFVAEDRGALLDPKASPEARERYQRCHATQRLRDLAGEPRGGDLWRQLRLVMDKLWDGCRELGLPALGSFLWRPSSTALLNDLELADEDLLAALRAFAHGVSFRDVDAEELGSVYESLLELHPEIHQETARFALSTAAGHERRTTGSYYTPTVLVECLLDSALEPALDEAAGKADPEKALLELRVCDPACGSGRFLVAAARRMALRLARVRSDGEEPSPPEVQRALRDVVGRCLFGVDLDPMAVELCKISLWMEAIEPGKPLSFLEGHIQQGNALLGATPALMDETRQMELKGLQVEADMEARFPADAWCAALVGPKQRGAVAADTRKQVRELAREHSFFHWHLAFPQVFRVAGSEVDRATGWSGGFDVVLGNPPWIAHAGRAAQPLPLGVKQFYRRTSPAFAGYPTTHGVFVHVAAKILRQGGRLGLVIPSSVSELGKYEPARAAHDALCGFPGELRDFGEGQFAGVTQPCMALTSQRVAGGRSDASIGSPWPMDRPDLDDQARRLLARIAELPTLPRDLFGERGFQSDRELAAHFVEAQAPRDRFTLPLREGADIREFQRLPPAHFADPAALGRRLRAVQEYRGVAILIRQTARFPVAAQSDGLAFRNSLLAGFEDEQWPLGALVVLLNSSFVRWTHYFRFRDARQPVMPQMKIGHLRSIPAPAQPDSRRIDEMNQLGRALSRRNAGVERREREELDRVVAELYGLSDEERRLVEQWHSNERRAGAR